LDILSDAGTLPELPVAEPTNVLREGRKEKSRGVVD